MAVIPVTASRKGAWLIFSWETVTDSDTCAAAYVNHNVSDMLMQVTGTFSSASISMTGGVTSSLGVTGLVDPAGDAIAITAAGGSAIRDLWPYMAPATVSGSSSDVDIEVRMKVVS
jgi:hypothetical protein